MTDHVAKALLYMLASRESVHDLPSLAPIGTLCFVRVGYYVSSQHGWVPYSEDDERDEGVVSADKLNVAAEYPYRWRCQLTCGCIVQTQLNGPVPPLHVRHWCANRRSDPQPPPTDCEQETMTDSDKPLTLLTPFEALGTIEHLAETVAEARDNNQPLDRTAFRLALSGIRKNLALIEQVAAALPRGPCIAIIEDDAEMRRAVARLASTVGFTEIRTYATVDAFAADCIGDASDVPDALVTDWDVPGGSGSAVLQRLLNLQREHRGAETFRIIHTARALDDAETWSKGWSWAVNVLVHKGDVVALKTTLGEAYAFALTEIGRCASSS